MSRAHPGVRRSGRACPTVNGQAGFSLVEVLIALVVLSLVMTTALSFLRAESAGFRRGSERFTVTQNARFAVNTMADHVRTSAAHLTPGQPALVYADSVTLAFNADFATNDANDVFAVYYERNAPDSAVTSLRASNQITIPGTSFDYPDTTYRSGGSGSANSPAETIIFVFRPDSTTTRSDDYMLLRHVNDLEPELVARNLLKDTSRPFLQYWQAIPQANGTTVLDTVEASDLPLSHVVPLHGAPADTGVAGSIDRIRAVTIHLLSTNGEIGADERTEVMTRLVRMPNTGIAVRQTCGDEPILGTSLSAMAGNQPNGEPAVNLSWAAATDETGGEEDVVRYVLWRRLSGESEWADPLLSIPSGQPSYVYTDTQVDGDETYDYALAAQDCTPTLSPLTSASGITTPAPTS